MIAWAEQRGDLLCLLGEVDPVACRPWWVAGAGDLSATTAASVGVGALVGWAAGSVGYGILGGAIVGVPAGIAAVYFRYREALS